MFSKFKQEKPSHVPEPEMRTGIIPFSLLGHATQKKSPRGWEISQLKKEKAMALFEEACEEANDTLMRRFGGSGLNQQLISYWSRPDDLHFAKVDLREKLEEKQSLD